MNLFVIGWSPSAPVDGAPAKDALAKLASGLPFFDPNRIETWEAPSCRVAAACVSHTSVHTGGVRYTHFEPARMALFSGRPFRWTNEFEADGRTPLDPRFYLAPASEWAGALDGRATAARYDDGTGTLEIYADRLGSYPVYSTLVDGTRWVSNNAELLSQLGGRRTARLDALAAFFGCGWALGGQPLWEGVDRLPRGALHRFRPNAPSEEVELLSAETIGSLFGKGFDRESARRTLVATVGALADWPGRPNSVPVTGGRDSRLVLAAALRAGIEFEARTVAFPHIPGYPDTGDVRLARLLCETLRLPHTVVSVDATMNVREAALVLRRISPATISLGDAVGEAQLVPGSFNGHPLELRHTGQGGELASRGHSYFTKSHYGLNGRLGVDDLVRTLDRILVHAWPPSLLTRTGRELVRRQVARSVREQVDRGIGAVDVPDAFFLFERMANWAGPNHGVFEYSADTTSPFWTTRLLEHEFGLPAEERSLELFHFHLLAELAPDLLRLPFDGKPPEWPNGGGAVSPRDRRLALGTRRVRNELRRRYEVRVRRPDRRPPDPLAESIGQIRRAVLAQPAHPAWDVLSRRRVVRLLRADPAKLDTRSRRRLWRVATVFLADEAG